MNLQDLVKSSFLTDPKEIEGGMTFRILDLSQKSYTRLRSGNLLTVVSSGPKEAPTWDSGRLDLRKYNLNKFKIEGNKLYWPNDSYWMELEIV